jgi:hypothetical protein
MRLFAAKSRRWRSGTIPDFRLQIVFAAIKDMLEAPQKPKRSIGFHG